LAYQSPNQVCYSASIGKEESLYTSHYTKCSFGCKKNGKVAGKHIRPCLHKKEKEISGMSKVDLRKEQSGFR